MSGKLPAIYVGESKTRVVTKVHDHSREAYGHNGVVKCDNEGCRKELILAGGVEMMRRKWYFALGETIIVTIAQAGLKNRDGSPYSHTHGPHGQDHADECDSPECNAFFNDEWVRFQFNKRAGNPGRSIVSPNANERPKSIAQMDSERATDEENARRASMIEIETRRQTQAQLWPLPR
ncbi:MAG: hypothetical protein WCC30_07540 [Candidatus Dormiibacterota bacterium]